MAQLIVKIVTIKKKETLESYDDTSSTETSEEDKDENKMDLFSMSKRSTQGSINKEDVVAEQAKQEAISFLLATGSITKKKLAPLKWWKMNVSKFPTIAELAQA